MESTADTDAPDDSVDRVDSAKLNAVIHMAVDGIIMIDEKGTIELFNPACEQLFGFKANEVLGENIKILMPPPYKQEHDRYLTNYIETGERQIIGIGREVVGQRKDRSTFPMELSVGEAIHHNKRTFIGIIRDITERKRDRKALEDSLRELESFSYSIAHDLKSPLRTVAGFAEALSDDYEDELDEPGQDYLQRIVLGAERMNTLINDLLAYSRLGQSSLNMELIDLKDIISEAIETLQPEIDESNAVVQINGSCASILGHRSTLEAVFRNLIGNAIKFVPKEKTPLVEIELSEEAGLCLCSVRDNGIGISRKHWNSIFEIFRRLHNDSEYPGTGIGLAIVKKALTIHGGTISLISEEGQGSTFTIRLPLPD